MNRGRLSNVRSDLWKEFVVKNGNQEDIFYNEIGICTKKYPPF